MELFLKAGEVFSVSSDQGMDSNAGHGLLGANSGQYTCSLVPRLSNFLTEKLGEVWGRG